MQAISPSLAREAIFSSSHSLRRLIWRWMNFSSLLRVEMGMGILRSWPLEGTKRSAASLDWNSTRIHSLLAGQSFTWVWGVMMRRAPTSSSDSWEPRCCITPLLTTAIGARMDQGTRKRSVRRPVSRRLSSWRSSSPSSLTSLRVGLSKSS